VRLLEYDILLRCQDRNPDGAMKSCQCLLHAQGAIGDEPYVIFMLERMRIRGSVCKKIERTLAQGEPSEASLAAMQQLLEREATEPLYLIGMRGERGHYDGYLAALQSGDASLSDFRKAFGGRSPIEDLQFRLFPGAAKANRAALLRYINQVVEFAKLPIEEQRARLTATEPERISFRR
jgi:hypothetical protein